MSTVFDDVLDSFQSVLQAAPAVAAVVDVDEVDTIPEEVSEAIQISPAVGNPQRVGGIEGQPVEWQFGVRVAVYARLTGASARTTANTLMAQAYARLAVNTDLGLGASVYIGDPVVNWAAARHAQHFQCVELLYTVRCRTEAFSLETPA